MSRRVEFTSSAYKHGVEPEDTMFAVAMAYLKYRLGEEGGEVWLYLGPKRPPSTEWLEVMLEENADDQTVFIFHSMPMRPKWQYLLDDQQRGS